MDMGKTFTDGPKDKEVDDDALPPRNDIDRHYVSRKEREFTYIVDWGDATIRDLEEY